MDLQPLSDVIEGRPLLEFMGNDHFEYFLNTAALCNLLTKLSLVDVNDYILDAAFGFDKINNELIISNNSYEYSYVFNFESMSWHKVSVSYQIFINDYPTLLGLNSLGVFDLGIESDLQPLHFSFVTQPQTLGAGTTYKKLERSVLRCNLAVQDGTYLTFSIFASDDLLTWQFITGGQRAGKLVNLLTTRSHGSAKYYIFVIAGQIKLVDSSIKSINYVNGIDVDYTTRLENKLRK